MLFKRIRDLFTRVDTLSTGVAGSAKTTEGWDDYLSPGFSLASQGASAPALTNLRDNVNLMAYLGTGTQVKQANGSIHILHDYTPGTSIHPHIHWTHNEAAPSGDVKWLFEYTLAKGHAVDAFPATTQVSLIEAAGVQYTHHVTEDLTGITSDSIEPDTLILFSISRDPADVLDTFTGDAFLLQVDLHVQVNNRYTYEKITPFTQI